MTGESSYDESLSESLRGLALCSTVALCAVAYSFQFATFLDVKEAVLAVGLVLVAGLAVVHGTFPFSGVRAFGPLWLLAGWCLAVHVGFGVARVRVDAVVEIARMAVLLLFVAHAYEYLQVDVWRNRILASLEASMLVVAALGLIQYTGILPLFPEFPHYDQRVYSVFGNQDLFGGYVALGIPLMVHGFLMNPRIERRMLGGLMILVPALLVSGSRSAWLACAAGLLVTLFADRHEWRRIVVLALPLAVVGALTCVLAPQATVGRIAETFAEDDVGGRARLWFWDGTLRMIRDSPVVGVGLGNFAYHSPAYLGEALTREGGEGHYHNDLHTLHAHSDPLELQAETGLAGTALVLWLLWSIRNGRGREWGGLAALLVFSLFNGAYHSAPHALAGLLFVGGLKARAGGEEEEEERDAPGWEIGVSYLSVAVAGGLLWFTLWAVVYPSHLLRKADDLLREGELADAVYEVLLEHRWPQYGAREEWGAILIERGEFEAAAESLALAARGLDTGRVWYFRGIAAEGMGELEQAAACYRKVLERWPFDVYTWERLVPLAGPDERPGMKEEAGRWLPDEVIGRLFAGG